MSKKIQAKYFMILKHNAPITFFVDIELIRIDLKQRLFKGNFSDLFRCKPSVLPEVNRFNDFLNIETFIQ